MVAKIFFRVRNEARSKCGSSAGLGQREREAGAAVSGVMSGVMRAS